MLLLHLTAVSPAKADDFLDLVINDGVIVPWEINNIAPGSSGVVPVDIRNAGSISGYMAVWIDGIIDTEGENPEAETGNTEEPGELSQYLTLNISGGNISPYTASPDFKLPVALNEFPQNIDHPLQLSDQPLQAGGTIQLQWEWGIPPQTTNVIQGDRVSFNIHYILTQDLLVQKPSTSTPAISGGGYWPEDTSDDDTQDDDREETEYITDSDMETDGQQATDTDKVTISDDSKIAKVFCSPDGKLCIKVTQRTEVISVRNEELSYIKITLYLDTLLIPQNNILLSPIYEVVTFTAEGQYEYPELDTPVIIVIEFDKDKLPERFISIYVARYTEDSSWVKITDVLEIDYEVGTITVRTTQPSTVAVFAETDGDKLKPSLPDSKAPRDIERTSVAESTLVREILRKTSLVIAGGGALAMATLAYIERKRRNSKLR